ncbi:hypothetical protein BGZ72_000017 [Mortierella alpina]|nr:hypothetical protein BGZ72_000017 [Mortierella alpina]
MGKRNNKTVVILKHPNWDEVLIPGEHIVLTTKELDDEVHENEILTRNLYLNVSPYVKTFRSQFHDLGLSASPIPINEPVCSFVVGEVIASKNSQRPVGSVVTGYFGWEEYSRLSESIPLQIIQDPGNPKIPLSNYTGALSMSGFTAYGSLLQIGRPKAGEIIYVSAASGAVGQIVGQMAKLLDLRVVGSAGSDEKVDLLLKELKFDAAFQLQER